MTTKASPVEVTGPLAQHAEGFKAELAARGYTPLSAANQLRLMAHLSRWLEGEQLELAMLDEGHAEAFLAARRAAGYTCWRTMRGLFPLLDHLRREGEVPLAEARQPTAPVELLLGEYRSYLSGERGLAASTVEHQLAVAGAFLQACAERNGGLRLDTLSAGEVLAYVRRACDGRSVGFSKTVVTGLRSLLRYLHLSGALAHALHGVVPSVAGWRDSGLPKALPRRTVQALLSSCDRRQRVGRRDHAILLLLARLGLRAGEVAALQLSDLDWRAGELVVHGKARRDERLPLPSDVGAAIAAYLTRGRPPVSDRHVFVRAIAPLGPLGPGGVQHVVEAACSRAGLERIGAHRLRHSLASELLTAGSSLPEIGQVLRHRSIETTAIYAKIDHRSLSGLALAWPEGER